LTVLYVRNSQVSQGQNLARSHKTVKGIYTTVKGIYKTVKGTDKTFKGLKRRFDHFGFLEPDHLSARGSITDAAARSEPCRLPANSAQLRQSRPDDSFTRQSRPESGLVWGEFGHVTLEISRQRTPRSPPCWAQPRECQTNPTPLTLNPKP